MTEILETFSALSFKEQEETFKELRDYFKKERARNKALREKMALDNHINMMYDFVKVERDYRSRTREQMMMRVIVANILIDEGFTTHQIGEHMGKDHSTICYLKRQYEAWKAFPSMFKKEMEMYKKIKGYETYKRTIQRLATV